MVNSHIAHQQHHIIIFYNDYFLELNSSPHLFMFLSLRNEAAQTILDWFETPNLFIHE